MNGHDSQMTLEPGRYVLLHYAYVPDMLERRVPVRPLHLEHASAAKAKGLLLFGGAVGDPPTGGLLVFGGDALAEAEEFARNDPYNAAGLITSWRTEPYTVAI